MKQYAVAKDMQEGDYKVKYRDDKGPGKHPQIETASEANIERTNRRIGKYREDSKTPEERSRELKERLREMQKRDLEAFRDLFG